ncbi:lipoprotein [Pseudovibrio sp. Tun.PSC04-5.I4]|uniref:lipoprotein n=1 Tax=Pseudovibrio sp. Tun.PSC04-5.I4 TaxID=1798213 RepID=UPI001AD8A5CA|nr:lipoprotein [Pseudovibrio sp. Tun.PSC04-5.I4]
MTDITKSRSSKLLIGLTIIALGLSVSACGRKGNLDSPRQAQADADGTPALNDAPVPQIPGDKDESLFLDPLIGADSEDDDFNF